MDRFFFDIFSGDTDPVVLFGVPEDTDSGVFSESLSFGDVFLRRSDCSLTNVFGLVVLPFVSEVLALLWSFRLELCLPLEVDVR